MVHRRGHAYIRGGYRDDDGDHSVKPSIILLPSPLIGYLSTNHGGSSSGFGVAASAGFASFSIGTETAGSRVMTVDRAALYTYY